VRRCGIAIAAVLAALVAAGALVLVAGGVSARPEPSAAEAWIARRLRSLAIPPSARAERNPVPPGREAIDAGRAHFADHCAVCHGNDGRGRTEMGRGLYPRPPDLTRPATQRLSDGELFWIIENGVRFTGMPAWGHEEPGEGTEDSWRLVHFIRHLPQLGPAELREMERQNPRPPAEAEEREQEEKFLEGGAALPHSHR
jgi:mono/diheme cytochrome c family protein